MSLAKQIITLHFFGRHGCRTSLRKAHTSLLFHQLTDLWLPQSRCLYVFLPLSSCWPLYSLCVQSVYTPPSSLDLLPWKASTLKKELYCVLSYHSESSVFLSSRSTSWRHLCGQSGHYHVDRKQILTLQLQFDEVRVPQVFQKHAPRD